MLQVTRTLGRTCIKDNEWIARRQAQRDSTAMEPSTSQSSGSSDTPAYPTQLLIQLPKPQKRTAMACQFCRRRKMKCDGIRPICGHCNKRNNVCTYIPVSMDTNTTSEDKEQVMQSA